MIDYTPREHPNDIAKRTRDSIARGAYAKAQQDARHARADPIEPNPPWPPYSPDNPVNNTDPLHEVGVGAAVAFGMPGRLATPLHEISFIANAIPRSNYPLDTVQIYLGMSRQLTQQEADYLNGTLGG